MYDLLIKNGRIIDGSGAPWFRGDVGIREGKIVAVGKIRKSLGREVIDATGLVVSPGFIDIHTHSDLSLLVNGRGESKIRQGVTTEVTGNCGYSPAPVSDKNREELKEDLQEEYGLELSWSTFPEYIERLESSSFSVNIVPLVGHGALRAAVMGYEQRKPTHEELEEMKRVLNEAMEAGAFGFSSGLIYPPSSYAEVDELVELAKIAASNGGVYTTHMRYEGSRLIDGVREAIEVGERSGVPVEISHHKVTDRKSWGLVAGSMAIMEEARKRGVDVTFDLYPYLATSTELTSIIPDWAHEGGIKKMLARFEETDTRKRILKEMVAVEEPQGWENIVVSAVHNQENKDFEGMNLEEIGQELGMEPGQAVLELISREKGRVDMIRFAMCEDDVKRVLAHDLSMIGSDGSNRADYGILSNGKPHPRIFGTFPRVLGKYSREEGVISLEKAVNKMTGLPAWRFGLSSKGLIRVGMDADITIFDPERVIDRATFLDPFQYPEGIEKVIVAGRTVIDQGRHTGVMNGRVLKNRSNT